MAGMDPFIGRTIEARASLRKRSNAWDKPAERGVLSLVLDIGEEIAASVCANFRALISVPTSGTLGEIWERTFGLAPSTGHKPREPERRRTRTIVL